jgi:hypothetical protein
LKNRLHLLLSNISRRNRTQEKVTEVDATWGFTKQKQNHRCKT